jgi:hypothetical protein
MPDRDDAVPRTLPESKVVAMLGPSVEEEVLQDRE